MAENNSTRERLNWLLLESLLIVVSILMAFSIDAWWENSQREDEERALLSAIVADLKQNRDELKRIQRAREIGLVALERFLASTPEQLSALTADEATTLLDQLNIAMAFRSFDIAIRSDDLDLISDPTIRRELGVWNGLANNVEQDVQIIISSGQELRREMDLNALLLYHGYQTPDPVVSPSELLAQHRSSADFVKARLLRQRPININTRAASKLLEHTNQLIALIDQ